MTLVKRPDVLGQKNDRVIFSALICRENQHQNMGAQKINAFKTTRLFCVWKINHFCWGITPSTHKEISSSCENRTAQTQISKDLLGTNAAEGLRGRRSHEKWSLQTSVSRWKQASSRNMRCSAGKGKQKAFLSVLFSSLSSWTSTIASGPFHCPSVKFLYKLFNLLVLWSTKEDDLWLLSVTRSAQVAEDSAVSQKVGPIKKSHKSSGIAEEVTANSSWGTAKQETFRNPINKTL